MIQILESRQKPQRRVVRLPPHQLHSQHVQLVLGLRPGLALEPLSAGFEVGLGGLQQVDFEAEETIRLQVLHAAVHQVLQLADPRKNSHRRAAVLLRPLREGLQTARPLARSPLHPLAGEAFQMRRMRQRFLPVQNYGRPQNFAHGGVAAQVPDLSQELQPEVQPEDTPADAHRPQAVRVQPVQEGLPTELRPKAAQVDSLHL